MSESKRDTSSPGKVTRDDRADDDDDIEAQVEDGVEELAATFGAGPKAAPTPEGPMEGQQLAP